MSRAEEFARRRQRGNQQLLRRGDLSLKRFLALDDDVYADGQLPARTKELLGLVASLVLRCDDCVTYHLLQARRHGVSSEEVMETMTVALVVGGSVVIPHLRKAMELLEEEEHGNDTA
ncbi:MAG: carboxymuconolactone decarboxylase family protein [Candidatus Bipolaricaulota bacterium]